MTNYNGSLRLLVDFRLQFFVSVTVLNYLFAIMCKYENLKIWKLKPIRTMLFTDSQGVYYGREQIPHDPSFITPL